jgi:alkaline phosphatase
VYIAYGTYDPLTVTITHILNRKAGIAWTSCAHTDIFEKLSAAMRL